MFRIGVNLPGPFNASVPIASSAVENEDAKQLNRANARVTKAATLRLKGKDEKAARLERRSERVYGYLKNKCGYYEADGTERPPGYWFKIGQYEN